MQDKYFKNSIRLSLQNNCNVPTNINKEELGYSLTSLKYVASEKGQFGNVTL
jgi:hypothetical protein